MQIGAINSVNFKGNLNTKQADVEDTYIPSSEETDSFARSVEEDDLDDMLYTVSPKVKEKEEIIYGDEGENSPLGSTLKKNFESFEKSVKNAQQDVHPLTCALGLATAAFAFKNGKKVASCARSTVAVMGGAVAKTVTKLASKVVKSIDFNKASEKINGVVESLSSKVEANDPKLKESFVNTIDIIFSRKVDGKMQQKGEAVVGLLNKFGVYLNKPSMADAVIAGVAAYKAADIATDYSEGFQDSQAIKMSAKKNLGSEFTSELIRTLAE